MLGVPPVANTNKPAIDLIGSGLDGESGFHGKSASRRIGNFGRGHTGAGYTEDQGQDDLASHRLLLWDAFSGCSCHFAKTL